MIHDDHRGRVGFQHRVQSPERAQRLLGVAAAVLLVATPDVAEGHGLAVPARPAGVLVGGVLAMRHLPFPVVIVAAAATTPLLRLCGVS
ncbi:MAG: AzlD domain-containing protein [Streptosporangiaceae bacterium]